jgi:hypothetical protein
MTNDPNKSGKRNVATRYSDPLSALRAEMDSLFDSFIGGLPAFSGMFGSSGARGHHCDHCRLGTISYPRFRH